MNAWARDRAGGFYLAMGLIALAAVAVGFSTTYAMPVMRRSFSAPLVVHLHGAFCLTWVLLFIAQTFLVRSHRTPAHRRLGKLGIPVALGILATGMATAHWATGRDLANGIDVAPASMIGTFTSLTIFTGFVLFGIVRRRRPDWHKRLLLLATIVVLWPAYFRFRHLLPMVPRPEIWLGLLLADAPILIAAIRDKLRYGKVHPVWLWFGSALFVEQCLEALLFGTAVWNDLGMRLYALGG